MGTNIGHSLIKMQAGSSLVQAIACCLFGAQPLPVSMVAYCKLHMLITTFKQIWIKSGFLFLETYSWKCRLKADGHLVQATKEWMVIEGGTTTPVRHLGTTNVSKKYYNALPISRGHFSPKNSRKAPKARPLRRGMGVFREFGVWPKFYLRSCCTVCNSVLHCTAIYRESIIPC